MLRRKYVLLALVMAAACVVVFGVLTGEMVPDPPHRSWNRAEDPDESPRLVGRSVPPAPVLEEQPQAQVRGRVELAGRASSLPGPQPSVHVSLSEGDRTVATLATPPGSFSIPYGGRPSTSHLRATFWCPGYVPLDVPVPEGMTDVGVVTLEPGLSYSGRFVDDSGGGVPGITGQIWSDTGLLIAQSCPSDATGRFRIPLGAHRALIGSSTVTGSFDAYRLVPLRGGLTYSAVSLEVSGFISEHVVPLSAPETIRLRFLSAEGVSPLVGARVRFAEKVGHMNRSVATHGPPASEYITDEEGIIAPRWPPFVEEAELAVTHEDQRSRLILERAVVVASAVHDVPVAAMTIARGVRCSRDGLPLRQARVEMYLGRRDHESSRTQQMLLRGLTDADGYLWWHFPEGAWEALVPDAAAVQLLYELAPGVPQFTRIVLSVEQRVNWGRGERPLDVAATDEVPALPILWIATPTGRPGGAAPIRPVGVSARVEIRSDFTTVRDGDVLDARPVSAGKGWNLWRVTGLRKIGAGPGSIEVARTQEIQIWIRDASARVGRTVASLDAWNEAFDPRTPLRVDGAAFLKERSITFRVLDERGDAVAGALGMAVPAGAGDGAARLARQAFFTASDGTAEVGVESWWNSLRAFVRDPQTGAAALASIAVEREHHEVVEVVLEAPVAFKAVLRLPDGTVPKRIHAVLQTEPRWLAEQVKCRVDSSTGEVSAESVVTSIYRLIASGIVSDDDRSGGGIRPKFYRAEVAAGAAQGQHITLR